MDQSSVYSQFRLHSHATITVQQHMMCACATNKMHDKSKETEVHSSTETTDWRLTHTKTQFCHNILTPTHYKVS